MNTAQKIDLEEVENELMASSDGSSIRSSSSSLTQHTLRWTKRPTLQDDGDSNWIFSYADMMTLLMGFFVIVATLSVPDPKRIQALRKMASSAMNVNYEDPYSDLLRSLQEILKGSESGKNIAIEERDDGLNLVSAGTVFFDSASVELRPEATRIVDQLAAVLIQSATKYNVIVEGHTDDLPVKTEEFPSNWELSAGRASRVVRLLEEKGFPHTQLRPLGFGDTMPVADSQTKDKIQNAKARAKNRRIVIRIRRRYEESSLQENP